MQHQLHRTLKIEATRPAGSNFLQQQAKFDAFVREFNYERPHEALDMRCPADVYTSSTRPYRSIGELSYPFHDRTVLVTYCGRICIFKKKINLSSSLGGSSRRYQGGRRWHLAGDFYGLRSWLHRSGGKKPCNP